MRYMLMRKADAATEEGVLPSQELLQAMGDYNERMIRAGVFVTGDGLRPSREGCRIAFRDGEPRVTEGPFSATDELLAGYTVLEVDSLEEAVEWARDWPREDGDVTLELRRYFTFEDFAPGAGLQRHAAQARMPRGLQVHLSFPGSCREAMAFYAEVTGGHLEAALTYGETPAAKDVPPEWHDRIAHASLNVRGHRLMGADMPGDGDRPPQGAQLFLDYDDVDQAAQVFQRLAEGGQVLMPFEATFWARGFGMVSDRFGVQWMVATPSDQCP
ncbi:YciI family protein [Halomonas salina]|uniref:PhnB-like protein n=1 Tax=Halomonas salina TaxID=42565 RepID=A0ABR4WU12_9GAMM|nr:YciI family protein [Halomonas salina]KGE78207.1 phnB-like protein [Halomonas salina]